MSEILEENKIIEETKTETEKEIEKPKKIRNTRPKFDTKLLSNEEKGIQLLKKKLENFNPLKCTSEKEALNILMKKYQLWLYQLYPADFEDMCWKLIKTICIKSTIQQKIYKFKGINRIIGEEIEKIKIIMNQI